MGKYIDFELTAEKLEFVSDDGSRTEVAKDSEMAKQLFEQVEANRLEMEKAAIAEAEAVNQPEAPAAPVNAPVEPTAPLAPTAPEQKPEAPQQPGETQPEAPKAPDAPADQPSTPEQPATPPANPADQEMNPPAEQPAA